MTFRLYLVLAVLAFVSATGSLASAQERGDALTHLDRGRLAAARTALEALLVQAPAAVPHYYLGTIHLQAGRPDAAKASFDRAAALDARAPLALVGQGEWALYSGDVAGAGAAFEQAVQRSRGKDAEVHYRIGLAHLRYGTGEAAVEALEKALALDAGRAACHAALGDARLAGKDYGAAGRSYEQALYFDPASAPAHTGVGRVFEAARQYAEATRKYQEAIAADAEHAPAYEALAGIYFLARQYDRAVATFARFLDLTGGGSPDDRFRQAGYLYLDRQYAASLDLLRGLGDGYPNPVVHRLLAYGAYETKDYAAGLAQMGRFLKAVPEADLLPADHEYYGRLLLAAGGDTTAAVERLRRAVAADTTKQTLRRDIAQVLFAGRRYSDSAAEYEAMAAAGAPLTATDYLNLGKARYFARAHAPADTAFARVNELAQSSALGWLWRARNAARMDPESTEGLARPFYLKYIELTADTARYRSELVEANFYLGFFYYLNEETILSRKYLDVVAALDPQHPHAKTLLEALAAHR